MELIQQAQMQDYLMQAYIATNPHTKEPKKMIEELQKQLDVLAGVSRYETDPQAKPEKGAFATLKSVLNKRK